MNSHVLILQYLNFRILLASWVFWANKMNSFGVHEAFIVILKSTILMLSDDCFPLGSLSGQCFGWSSSSKLRTSTCSILWWTCLILIFMGCERRLLKEWLWSKWKERRKINIWFLLSTFARWTYPNCDLFCWWIRRYVNSRMYLMLVESLIPI